MLNQSKIKQLRSLQQKKYRNIANLFFIEGEKMLQEVFLQTKFRIHEIFVTEKYAQEHEINLVNREFTIITERELKQISALKTPNSGFVTLSFPEYRDVQFNKGLFIYLDKIQDPGNLGTIIRTADWFGVDAVFCSLDTVDVFNPKVLQSTMGAVFRTPVFYMKIEELITDLPETKIAGAFLDGENIYKEVIPENLLLVLGNESQGISAETARSIMKRWSIPNYAKSEQKTESLNVAMAGSIFLAEYRRRFPI